MWASVFAGGWRPILRVVIIGTCSYVIVVGLLRYFGKRALTKMNAFDLVVTVALGSALANVILSKDVTLADGMVAFTLLLVLQRSFAALAIRLGWFGRYLKAQPTLIVYRGEIRWAAAHQEQLGMLEILGGIRNSGVAAVEDVLAMVLSQTGPSALSLSAPRRTADCRPRSRT